METRIYKSRARNRRPLKRHRAVVVSCYRELLNSSAYIVILYTPIVPVYIYIYIIRSIVTIFPAHIVINKRSFSRHRYTEQLRSIIDLF